jgi:lipopolysaccharide export system permease protein
MARMSILPRYFIRIFLPVFALCLAVFSGVLLMNHFLRLFNMAVMKGISPLWIAGCFVRLIPFVLSIALPMAFLVSLLITLGQLCEGGEIMALRASGFSFAEMTWPFLAVALVLAGLLLYLNHKASPEGFHSFRNRYEAAAGQVAWVEIEPRSFVSLGPWRLFAQKTDSRTGDLEDVYLVRRDASRGIRISARRGRLSLEAGRAALLELMDGELQLPNPDPERFTSGRFERYLVEVPLAGDKADRPPDIQELSSPRLKALIGEAETTAQHKIEYTVELAVRSAAALSPLVFFWVGAPLGFRMGRHGRGIGFALSLGILFGFYALLVLGISLGRRHAGLASSAPWIADAAGLLLGAALTRRALST